jgi:hypothetical protein
MANLAPKCARCADINHPQNPPLPAQATCDACKKAFCRMHLNDIRGRQLSFDICDGCKKAIDDLQLGIVDDFVQGSMP